MTEGGKFYWLRVKGSRNPHLYLGETKAGRGKYTQNVMKPSCCLVYKGGEKLDRWIDTTNLANEASYTEKKAAFDLKYPPGTPNADLEPSLTIYEAVEVVAYKQKGKIAYKVKK